MYLGIHRKIYRQRSFLCRIVFDCQLAKELVVSISTLVLSTPAWAQLSQVNTLLNTIQNVFIGGLFVGCATVIAGMLIPTS
jgi:type IV secretion system protein VirB2